MNNVFGVYGIEVNPRHLTLVADHMTNTGSIQPFSRGAMAFNASPLQKMTYETTLKFMRDAIVKSKLVYF
jgi:DNA-directed RNA polymerase I subunit RPA1